MDIKSKMEAARRALQHLADSDEEDPDKLAALLDVVASDIESMKAGIIPRRTVRAEQRAEVAAAKAKAKAEREANNG